MHDEDPEPDPRIVEALLTSFFHLAFHSDVSCTERALAFALSLDLAVAHIRLHPIADMERFERLREGYKERVRVEDMKVKAELARARH